MRPRRLQVVPEGYGNSGDCREGRSVLYAGRQLYFGRH